MIWDALWNVISYYGIQKGKGILKFIYQDRGTFVFNTPYKGEKENIRVHGVIAVKFLLGYQLLNIKF